MLHQEMSVEVPVAKNNRKSQWRGRLVGGRGVRRKANPNLESMTSVVSNARLANTTCGVALKEDLNVHQQPNCKQTKANNEIQN